MKGFWEDNLVCSECGDLLPSHWPKCSLRPKPKSSPANLDFVVGCRYDDFLAIFATPRRKQP